MTLLAIFLTLVFLQVLLSAALEKSWVTPPMVFAGAGMGVLFLAPGLRDQAGSLELWLHLAEAGLVLLLFTDASRTDLQVLRRIRGLPVRLLSAGMLLTLLLGALLALACFTRLSVWEAGILAAILAPTDAGLGQIIVNSPRVPVKIRQALNVEAGLNDGLSVPFLLFFIALAGAGSEGNHAGLLRFIVEQLGCGVLIGGGIGAVGGWLLNVATRRQWMSAGSQQLGAVALPLFCILASEACGASMFIAAFVAGLAVQLRFPEAGRHSVEFAEQWGQLLNLSVFFLFGMMVAKDWARFSAAHALYAILSLTVVRMIPVGIALSGAGLSRGTVLFMGWFGPRGLASIVLGLVYLEHTARHPGESTIRLAVMMTVLLSIVAHGLSAAPGIQLYARHLRRLPLGSSELDEGACGESCGVSIPPTIHP